MIKQIIFIFAFLNLYNIEKYYLFNIIEDIITLKPKNLLIILNIHLT